MGLIYCAVNKVNGKMYVGQTIHSLSHRKTTHLYAARSNTQNKYAFHKAIHKYGENAFSWKVLEKRVPNEKLDELEIIYVDLLDSFLTGYNLTMGGEGCHGCVHNAETRKKMSIAAHNKPPMTSETRARIGAASAGRIKSEKAKHKFKVARTGHIVSEDTRLKISKSSIGKKISEGTKVKMRKHKPSRGTPIKQYGINGFIAEFKSVAEASRNTGINRSNISNCCCGLSKTAGGFIWKYANPNDPTRQRGKPRPINQYTLDGQLVKVHPNIKSAAEEYGVKLATIQRACKRDGAVSCGYRWEYCD